MAWVQFPAWKLENNKILIKNENLVGLVWLGLKRICYNGQ